MKPDDERSGACGPQAIAGHGAEGAPVIPVSDLHGVRPSQATKLNFVDYILNGPIFESDDVVDEIFKRIPETPGSDIP